MSRAPRRTSTCAVLMLVVALAMTLACTGTRPPATAPATPQGSGGVNRAEHLEKPYVVLISLDGFRADYVETRDVPNLRRIAQRGARAASMMPVFPSLTFPNHYSLVTGLHPGRHGLVANSFYDPARRQTYSLSNRDTVGDGTWYGGEPIWVTAETQGMVASCFFFPGSEAAIRGVRPTAWRTYDAKVTMEERVKTVLEWLQLPPERRPHVITLYYSEIDSASHDTALDAPRVHDTIRAVDRSLGALLDGIDALPIREQVYLLVTSDHGMVETTEKHGVALDTLVDMKEVGHAFGGPIANIHLRTDLAERERRAAARRMTDRINARLQHGRAYLRGDMPARFHYRSDPRAGDVVVVMDESWRIVLPPPPSAAPRIPRQRDRWGYHGWDPALPSMQAIFVATGPGIRAGVTIPTVRNVDVYPMMTEVLGLRPARDIDGRPGLWKLLAGG